MNKINNIIESLINNLQNLKKNRNHNFYIGEKLVNILSIDKIRETDNIMYKADSSTDKKTKEIIEYDLFGNVIQKAEDWELTDNLEKLNELIKDCQKCPLGQLRKNFVFGEGNPISKVVLVGEAPGEKEDQTGRPFVGRAGQLLTKIIEATGFKREDVFICNVIKSRPPGNRQPMPEEVEKCKPYLDQQLKIIKPKFIIALGKVAAENLLNVKATMSELRGQVHKYHDIDLIVTYHPAALLRNEALKKPTWEDMKFFKKLYDNYING